MPFRFGLNFLDRWIGRGNLEWLAAGGHDGSSMNVGRITITRAWEGLSCGATTGSNARPSLIESAAMSYEFLRSRLHYYAAILWMYFNREPAAVAQYRKAIAYDARYVNAWRNLAFILAQGKDEAGAVDAYRKALVIAPDDHATRFNLGFVLHQHRHFDAAIVEFEQVVKLSPSHDRAWFGLGLCKDHLGRIDEAVIALKEATKIQYFNPDAGYHLALAYHKLGRHDEARAEYERVKSFDPQCANHIGRQLGLT
ncbi:MAG: tetratricopeptide repeat protein [Betaproteobacteria bacterium]|nr:tetratricopeptide repeat protein [Betaproteobacteria bacterium]